MPTRRLVDWRSVAIKESAIDTVAFRSSLPPSLPLHRVEVAQWVRHLTPVTANPDGTSWTVEPVSPLPLLERLTKLVGRAPVRWAVQVADDIARGLHRRYPHRASTEAEHRANRAVAECMALVSLESLATGRFPSGKVSAAAADAVRRHNAPPTSLKELLRTSADTHSGLVQEYLHACEELVRPDRQLRAAQAVSAVLLACAREYTEWIVSHQASPSPVTGNGRRDEPAVRRQLVDELLRGDVRREADAAVAHIEDRIGYAIADHGHRAFVVWQMFDDAGGVGRMAAFVADMVARAGANSVLVVDRPDSGAHWLWCHESPDADSRARLSVPPGLRVVSASTGRGLGGFRMSHARAAEVRRVAGSLHLPADRVVDYDSISGVLPFIEDLPRAAAFVIEELGRLADPGTGSDAQRQTLATLLRTQSVSATARELYITRSTVTYRLQKAESLLPPRWKERPVEVALALRLLDLFGTDAILGARGAL